MSGSALLAASLWPGALRAGDSAQSAECYFVCLNDLHYIDAGCAPFFHRLVTQIKASPEKIDFCLICGDLSDDGKPEQLGAMREILKGLNMPVHVTIGNHDFTRDNKCRAFADTFPDSLNYTFEHMGWQFVALDTCDGTKAQGNVGKPTLDYIEQAVPRLDRKRPLAIFTHFPLGPNVPMRPGNAEAVLSPFKEHNLRAVFSGHYHAYTERTIGKTVLTTDRCCSFRRNNIDGSKEKGYFLCRISEGEISRKFIEFKAV